jgi:hypothetical protein
LPRPPRTSSTGPNIARPSWPDGSDHKTSPFRSADPPTQNGSAMFPTAQGR